LGWRGNLKRMNWFEAAVHRVKANVPPAVVDFGLTMIGEGTVLWGTATSQNFYRTTWPWWVWVIGAALPLPGLWRRRAPFTAWLLTGVVQLVFAFFESDAANYNHSTEFPILVVCATVAYLGTTSQFAAAFALTVMGVFVSVNEVLAKSIITSLTISLAFAFGRLAAKQRQASVLLAARVRETEEAAGARAAEAAAAERTRIARDMHDILAHAVSLIVVQAEAGGAVARTSPDKAVRAFDAIGDTGRDALVQLRRMLGVLRDDDAVAVALAPQPTIAALPGLIDSVRSAEIEVVLESRGTTRPLVPDAEIAVFRTVQESLTNVVKHARASWARVELDWGEDMLAVRIADDGIGPTGVGVGQAVGAVPAPRGGGAREWGSERDRERGQLASTAPGRGLIGIHERISSCGGSVMSGPGPGGRGFLLTATLPLQSLVV
jgi:signal transduction histidine kinase